MKFSVITLFPPLIQAGLESSILGKALEKGVASAEVVDLRDHCNDKHRQADDAPFGGGGGMVMKAEPVMQAIAAAKEKNAKARVIFLSPQGKPLTHAKVMELAGLEGLILLCGHYEGIDQRALDAAVDEELSIGDYVLTGGELAALVVIDAVTRQLPGALGDENSAKNDSFFDGLLDTPHYTRPAELNGSKVPDVLLSGDHAAVKKWRREQALLNTFTKRPELLKAVALSAEDKKFLDQIPGLIRDQRKERES